MIQFLLLDQVFAEDAAHSTGEAGHETSTHEAGAHHDPHAIPWHSLGVQAFNFGVLFAILFVVLRKTVKAHFQHRAEEYKQMVARAEEAKAEAERGHHAIKERLAKLESTAEEGLARARSEAEDLKKKMMEEARTLSQRLQTEAERTAGVELEKAKAELRRELLQSALNASRESLKGSLDSSEQKKLMNEFADKIQVVGG